MLALGGCATSPLPFTSSEIASTSYPDGFSRGELMLECESPVCAFSWVTQQSRLTTSYADGDWEALAAQVSALQYGQDLAYFYLGRAAEELQAYDAAETYFLRAQYATLRCASNPFHDCQGLDIVAASRQARDRIATVQAAAEMQLADAQQILGEIGLYTAEVDGIYGPRTRAALLRFQTSRHLGTSGRLDSATARALAEARARDDSRVAAMPPATPVVTARRPEDATPASVVALASEAQKREEPSVVARTALQEVNEPEAREREPDIQASTQRAGAVAVASDTAAVPADTSITGDPGRRSAPAVSSSEIREREVQRTRLILEVDLLSRADPFAEVLSVVEQGAWVEVIARGAEWSKVSHGDTTGYVYSAALQ